MEVSLEMAALIWTLLAQEAEIGLAFDALESVRVDSGGLISRFEFFGREFDFCS